MYKKSLLLVLLIICSLFPQLGKAITVNGDTAFIGVVDMSTSTYVKLPSSLSDPSGSCSPNGAQILSLASIVNFVCNGGTWQKVSASVTGQGLANGIATLDSGTLLTISQFPALTGDVTKAAGSTATTVAKVGGLTASAIATAVAGVNSVGSTTAILKGNGSGGFVPAVSNTDYQAALGFTPENSSNKNAASGYAGLDSSSFVPQAELNFNSGLTGSTNITYQSLLKSLPNAVSFSGVDSTGTTNSTTGLQAAVTAVGNGTIDLPQGTYLSCNLTLGNYTKIDGHGSVLKAPSTGCPVSYIAPTALGSGYTSATVAISAPPSGTTATAVASITSGQIVSYTISNPGSGYTSAPTITITGNGTGAAATAYSAVVLIPNGGGLTTGDKLRLSNLTINANSVSGMAGIIIGNHSAIAMDHVGIINSPVVGLFLDKAQFGEYKQLDIYGNYVGLKIYSNASAGGGNSNTFYGAHIYANTVGVFENAFGANPLIENNFINPTISQNTVNGFASISTTASSSVYWYGGTPTANALSSGATTATVDGITIPRSVLYLNNTNVYFESVQDSDLTSANPLYVLTNNSNLALADSSIPGIISAQSIQSDSSSVVSFSGNSRPSGYVNNVLNYPKLQGTNYTVQLTGAPISIPNYTIPNLVTTNPIAPVLSFSSGILSNAIAQDSQFGTVQSIMFSSLTGGTTTNVVRIPFSGLTTNEDVFISYLAKSSANASFGTGLYGSAGSSFSLVANQWTRVVYALSNQPSSTMAFLEIYETDTNAATLSVTNVEVLHYPTGTVQSQNIISEASVNGYYNPNGYSHDLSPQSLTVNTTLAQPGTYFVSASSGAITITLPSAVNYNSQSFTVIKNDSTTNVVTVNSAAGTIGGVSSLSLPYNQASFTVVSDGTNWKISSATTAVNDMFRYSGTNLAIGNGTGSPTNPLTLLTNSSTLSPEFVQNQNVSGNSEIDIADSTNSHILKFGVANASSSFFASNGFIGLASSLENLIFCTGISCTERMKIMNDGNIGINNNNPLQLFVVGTNAYIDSNGNAKVSGFIPSVVTKTGAYTLTGNDYSVVADATSGAFTLTLPSGPLAGQIVTVKKKDSSSNTITISGNGANIDGTSTVSLSTQYQAFTLQFDGTNWNSLSNATTGGGGSSGTVTHTVGSLTANDVVIGNGTADIKVTGVGIDSSNNVTGVNTLSTNGFNSSIATKTTTYTCTTADYTIIADGTSAAFSVFLPSSPNTGQIINIKKKDSSANVITIMGSGKNIDGGTSLTMSTQYQGYTVQYDGTQWWIL